MNDAQTAHTAVVEAAKKLVRAWAQHVYTIQTYGEGEAEVLRPIVQQEEEGLQAAVADLLAATEPRVIRSISAADFARISDEFAKTLLPYDAMICEIHALRAERDALRTTGETVTLSVARADEFESEYLRVTREYIQLRAECDAMKARAEAAEREREAVYVQIECCADEIDILKHERDALRKDAARLNWLESAHTLQNNVEILYVVDGYNVDVIHHNGATRHRSLHGATLREALDFARAALTQEDA
jgi:uncharacterized coiled-coil DUF342 family protein